MRAEKSLHQPLSRSDLVRQRRQDRSSKRIAKTRDAVNRAPHTPAVTVRGTTLKGGHATSQTNRSKVKRQYYYTLGASGAELRLPALPMVNLGWRGISAIITVFSALAIFALGFSPQFQVTDVSIEGISRLTPGDIEAVIGAYGMQIVAFDTQTATANLERAFPELENVRIQSGFPAKIHIKVTELQPAVAWAAGENVYWIAANGVVLPPRGEPGELLTIGSDAPPPLLPQTDADASQADESAVAAAVSAPADIWGRQINPDILTRMVDLQSRIPADSKLVYSSLNGLGWEEPSGLDVYIGRDLTDFDLKISMYQSIISNLQQQGIQPRDMVSVEFIDAPFFR